MSVGYHTCRHCNGSGYSPCPVCNGDRRGNGHMSNGKFVICVREKRWCDVLYVRGQEKLRIKKTF